MQESGAGRRWTDEEVARCPRSAGMPALRRTRMIDERLGMFAQRLASGRIVSVEASIVLQVGPAVHGTGLRRASGHGLGSCQVDARAFLAAIRQQLPEPQARASFVVPDNTLVATTFDNPGMGESRQRVARYINSTPAPEHDCVRHGRDREPPI